MSATSFAPAHLNIPALEHPHADGQILPPNDQRSLQGAQPTSEEEELPIENPMDKGRKWELPKKTMVGAVRFELTTF